MLPNKVNYKLHYRQSPEWLLALLLAALWPHWLWMARRTMDGSDEPWGMLALVTLIGMVIADRRNLVLRRPALVLTLAGGLSLGAALCTSVLPPIISAAVAMLAVVSLLAGMLPAQRPRAALAFIALLALPLTASLNFYLGYPLRWICSHGAAPLLSLAGWEVTAEGAALLWNGKTILVDAPCAGIAMLWVGLYVAALLSYLHRASTLRTAGNLAIGALIVVAGNTVRNAILFFKEAGITPLPEWMHEAIGLAVFGLALWLMYHLFSRGTYAHR
jgi:exosortase